MVKLVKIYTLVGENIVFFIYFSGLKFGLKFSCNIFSLVIKYFFKMKRGGANVFSYYLFLVKLACCVVFFVKKKTGKAKKKKNVGDHFFLSRN